MEMNKNIVKNKTLTVEIRGVSNTSREDAINNAFRNLRAAIAEKDNDLIIYMRPVAVSIKDLQTEEYTERFLFLFMPRQRERVVMTLTVTVEYEALEL